MRMTTSKKVDWRIVEQYANAMKPDELDLLLKEIGETYSPEKARNFLAHLRTEKGSNSKH